MYCYLDNIPPVDLGSGILMRILGAGSNMNVVHWNLDDKSIVELHHHPQEQFGYVIAGGFEVQIGPDKTVLKAGDSYFVPSNVPHRFVAVGKTEAIDVFSPLREIPYHPMAK